MEPTIRKASDKDRDMVHSWPIWENEISEFPWEYVERETCFFLDGDVMVTNEDGKTFHCKKGDYVIFPKGMICSWNIRKPVKKHYKFG